MTNRHGLPVLGVTRHSSFVTEKERRVEQRSARQPHKLEVAGSIPAPATTGGAGRFTNQGERPDPARPAPSLFCSTPGCKHQPLIWRGEEGYCLNCISTILVREHREER